MSFEVGSLVRARGREWVVLPDSDPDEDLWVLRPLGGTDDEITGVYRPLESVEPATFPLPDPETDLGNHRSCSLLRDAVRLGFRSAAGPFRSLGRISVEPRPYQLVPLLMALRQETVRLLVADDVGVGKTVEACLIARELLDRAEIQRTCVICPPHLAEQWQEALQEQFHIDARLVLPSTVTRLERELAPGESLFERHPHTVVSMDYIKSERRRATFLRACPEFVIVDEAHTCTSGTGNRTKQMRHDLLQQLAADEERHLLLVTATPHSGKDENFRSLLTLLDSSFAELPDDLSGTENRRHRERLARHLVQRRRGDLEDYLDAHTPFPERELAEESYELHEEYRQLLDRILEFCRERVVDRELDERRQRVRWWSALALLRSLSSSPAAAAATLRRRASTIEAESLEEIDELGKRAVFDLDEETSEGIDVAPGSQTEDDDDRREHERLLAFARDVEKLKGDKDQKLQRSAALVKKLLDDGFSPIVFCRFIPTVEYVTEALREALPNTVTVAAVTGKLAPEERERRVEELGKEERRVLVCTDCLSEGINLQAWFDAVMHYDLSWNPTRHEQREGRVDRFGQEKAVVRTLTYYGADNPVDGIVLQVLLRKHKRIHKQLGITVPVPMDTNTVVEAIFEGLLLRESAGSQQLTFDFLAEEQRKVDVQWDAAVDREKRSRSLFAQHSIKADEVAEELEATRAAVGDDAVVRRFTNETVSVLGGTVAEKDRWTVLDGSGMLTAAREAAGLDEPLEVAFEDPAPRGATRLVRAHPVVSGLASYMLEAALDPASATDVGLRTPARRCGVLRTADVSERTTLLLLRLRFHLIVRRGRGPASRLLAEDSITVGFRGAPENPAWLDTDEIEALVDAVPTANTDPSLASRTVQSMLDSMDAIQADLDGFAQARGDDLLEAHQRVRKAAGTGTRSVKVEPNLPPDVLGVFVYLPAPGGQA